MFCTGLVLLERGKVVARGTPAEVLHPELIRRVYGLECEVTHHLVAGVRVITLMPPAG